MQRTRPIYPPRRPFGGPRQDSRDFGPRINDRIRISPVRLLDPQGEMLGVVPLEEAKRQAYDAGLDLVEISPDARPPVCKIMDFGKFKYEQSKKEKANKAKTKSSEMKEVRLGRSMKIDPHDVDIRIAQARRFLIEGHRVQIIQNFRGREMAFRSKGDERMDDIIQRLADLAKVEVPPRLNGRRMGMILVPEKQKVEAYKRKMLAEGKPVLPTIPEQLEEFEHEDDDHDHDDHNHDGDEGSET
ncbi:MAG: translation initiation factor IF-3 [bacterium]